jgi:hypothetical protein
MSVSELLRWQWDGYPRYHRARLNLMIHIVAVPLFLLGNVTLLVALFLGSWLVAGVAAVAMVVSIALQGRGHREEALPPEPFSGPLNAVARLFFEQWITFPRFVLSGGWRSALRQASGP